MTREDFQTQMEFGLTHLLMLRTHTQSELEEVEEELAAADDKKALRSKALHLTLLRNHLDSAIGAARRAQSACLTLPV